LQFIVLLPNGLTTIVKVDTIINIVINMSINIRSSVGIIHNVIVHCEHVLAPRYSYTRINPI